MLKDNGKAQTKELPVMLRASDLNLRENLRRKSNWKDLSLKYYPYDLEKKRSFQPCDCFGKRTF